MKVAFLFPGQGSQVPNMLKALPETVEVKETLAQATETLGESVYNFHSENALTSTKAVQIATFVNGVAAFRLFQSRSIQPDFVAGHSVGAFAAAVAAGVVDFSSALKIVKTRGELMESLYPKGYGMGVVLGMDMKQLVSIVDEYHRENNPVYITNLNAPGQVTISGSLKGLQHVIDKSLQNGAQCASLLDVNTPSHSPLLVPVAEKLKKKLHEIDIQSPVIPYAGNQRARLLYEPDDIREDLAISVSSPVKWHDATTVLFEKGVRLFIELPPGNVLTRLAMNAFPEARTLSVAEDGFEDCMYVVEQNN